MNINLYYLKIKEWIQLIYKKVKIKHKSKIKIY